MEKIKKSIVYIPLIATVLFIAIGIAVLIANQPNEIKANTSGESIGFIENNAGNDPNLAGGYKPMKAVTRHCRIMMTVGRQQCHPVV